VHISSLKRPLHTHTQLGGAGGRARPLGLLLDCHHCGHVGSIRPTGGRGEGRNAKVYLAIEKRVVRLCGRVEHENISTLDERSGVEWATDSTPEAAARRRLEVQKERGPSQFFEA